MKRYTFLASIFLLLPLLASADSVITLKGQEIKGTIKSETDETVILNSDYGELTFRKVDLSKINRTSGGGNTFGSGGGGSSNSNPFSSGGSNAFGGGNSSNAFGSPSASNQNPFAPRSSNQNNSNPFSAQPAQPIANTPVETKRVYSLDDLSPRPVVDLPTVPVAWDGVLFDINDSAEYRKSPQSNIRISDSDENNFFFITPLTVSTDNTRLRVALKSGEDMVRLNPRSQIRLAESSARSSKIELLRGALWLDVESSGGNKSIQVMTQSSTITADGSAVFRVADALEQGIHIAVISGTVEVQSNVAQVSRTLTSGNMILVRPEGCVSDSEQNSLAINYENKGWETLDEDWWITESRTDMGVGMLNVRDLVSRNELNGLIRDTGNAFRNYTKDTGDIPTEQDGYSILLENTKNQSGWNGPYLEGLVPPIDSWGRALRYTARTSTGSSVPVGIVYSLGEDGRDNSGNPSADITEMILYYQIVKN